MSLSFDPETITLGDVVRFVCSSWPFALFVLVAVWVFLVLLSLSAYLGLGVYRAVTN